MLYTPLLCCAFLLGADPTVPETLRAMRDNARLYDNLEVEYVLTGTADDVDDTVPRGIIAPKTWTSECLLVFQGAMYFVRINYSATYRESDDWESEDRLGFDGETSRAIRDGDTGLISDKAIPVDNCVPPQRWGFPQSQNHDTADFIEATGSALHTYPDLQMESAIVGQEPIGGLECIRIRSVLRKGSADKPNEKYDFWVCPERNYLVARSMQYSIHNDALPQSVTEVTAWREYSPGVWLPMRAENTKYDPRALLKGEHVRIVKQIYELKSASFDPNHDASFFRDVPMPEVGTIYTLKDDEIVSEETRAPQ